MWPNLIVPEQVRMEKMASMEKMVSGIFYTNDNEK